MSRILRHRILTILGPFVLGGVLGLAVFALYPKDPPVPVYPVGLVGADPPNITESPSGENIFLPIRNFYRNQTERRFGWPFTGRFNGYHMADDIEVNSEELDEEIPIYAIDDGKVLEARQAEGYGGLMVIEHEIGKERIVAIYGHMSISDAPVKEGDAVQAGQFIGYLGQGFTEETDGNRKHLHFGLYRGLGIEILGYLASGKEDEFENWLNPTDFLSRLGARLVDEEV